MTDINQILTSTYKKEQKLLKVDLNKEDQLSVMINKDEININTANRRFKRKLDRPIIHQLGSRLYGYNPTNSFDEINKKVQSEIATNSEFNKTIADKLSSTDSILYINPKNSNIYGLVSSRFTELNPLEIRQNFESKFSDFGLPLDENYSVGFTPFGEPFETYNFETPKLKTNNDEPINYQVKLIYGLNNGYSSYRIILKRKVLVCSNGMTSVERSEFAKLKHVANPNIESFIKKIEESVINYNTILQKKIQSAKNRQLNNKLIDETFNRLHTAQIVKNRVKNRLQTEINDYGNNEWALSQAFTNIATHFYKPSYDKKHEKILTEIGSSIVDQSLTEVINAPIKKTSYGNDFTYGNLLPKTATN